MVRPRSSYWLAPQVLIPGSTTVCLAENRGAKLNKIEQSSPKHVLKAPLLDSGCCLSLGAQGTNAIDDQGLFVYMEMCAELENNI
jgi:hypothetical protein